MRSAADIPELRDRDRPPATAPPPPIKAPTPKTAPEVELERFKELGSWSRSKRGNLYNTLGKWGVTLCRGPRAVKIILSNRRSFDGEQYTWFEDGTLTDREIVQRVAERFRL